jgi:hypothetical protein
MPTMSIFLSVGGTSTENQESFVRAVEDRLRIEGLVPHTVGRTTYGPDAPLKTVTQLMERCAGTVVLALERTYLKEGKTRWRQGQGTNFSRCETTDTLESY